MIRGLLLVALTAGAIASGPGIAVADDGPSTLIDASPGVDAVVVRPPEEISLSFRAPVAAAHVRLFKDGDVVSSSDAAVEGTLAIARVESKGPGDYLVDWKGTDAAGAAIAGAYVFRVDPRGNNSIAVDREVAGAIGALGGLRVTAAAIAAMGAVALLIGVVGWVGHAQSGSPRQTVGIGALATALGSLAAGATYGVPSDGSLRDLLDLASLRSVAASGPGRAWLTAALLMGLIPFVLVLGRSISSRLVAASALVIAAAGAVWVAIGLGWLVRLPWPLMSVGVATAAAIWLSIEAGRPAAVGVALLIGLFVAVPIVSDVRASGESSVVLTDGLLMEASIDPARLGVNELHLYGFDVSGRVAALGPTSVSAYHREMDVGPLDLPVLRAGPNHFLSYRATLPLFGEWGLAVNVTSPEGDGETATMEVQVR